MAQTIYNIAFYLLVSITIICLHTQFLLLYNAMVKWQLSAHNTASARVPLLGRMRHLLCHIMRDVRLAHGAEKKKKEEEK